jgi:hypothetical protein
LDYDGLAWVIATVYATAISALPSPAELKPASVQCGSEAAPRTGFQRGMELGRSVLLDASAGSVLLGRAQLGSLITRKIVASSMAYLRRQARHLRLIQLVVRSGFNPSLLCNGTLAGLELRPAPGAELGFLR